MPDTSYYVVYAEAVEIPSNGDFADATAMAPSGSGDTVVSGGFRINPTGEGVAVTNSAPEPQDGLNFHYGEPGYAGSPPGGWTVRARQEHTPTETQYLIAYAVCKHDA